MGILCPTLIVVGAVVVYFVVMCQCLYPLILCIISWCSGETYTYYTKTVFNHFSQGYCGFIMYPILIALTSKKDLSIFMKVGSIGVVFILFLMVFLVAVGIKSLTNTHFSLGTMEESDATVWDSHSRTLVLFNLNFAPLAGDLCTGYFLHTCSLSVLRASKNPEKSNRDLFLGYLLVWLSYAIVGTFGYIGFMGYNYREYFKGEQDQALHGQIAQNCLMMFAYTKPGAFVLRLAMFVLLFSTYPLVHYFLTSMLLLLFWSKRDITRKEEIILNVGIITIPLLFTLFYPQIGTILGYVGAVAGFPIIYVLPVMVHLKRMKTRITNPLLAEAIDMNAFIARGQVNKPENVGGMPTSPKLRIRDDFLKKNRRTLDDIESKKRDDMNRYYT